MDTALATIMIISYTISKQKKTYKEEGFGNKMYMYQNYSQMLDTCTRLDLKTDDELFSLRVYETDTLISISGYEHYDHWNCNV